MDPMLIGLNLVVGAIGALFIAAGSAQKPRWFGIVVGVIGCLLIMSAIIKLPSQALQTLKEPATAEGNGESNRAVLGDDSSDDDSSVEESNGQIVIIGEWDLIRKMFVDDAVPEPPTESVTIESVTEPIARQEPTPTVGRDPFVAPAVIEPQREHSLPEEPKTGEPKCSSPGLLHGPSGGPAQNGCYAIGCAEGYALPMQLLPDRWMACTDPKRFERIGDCYYFHDADGSEQSVRLNDGSWVPCK